MTKLTTVQHSALGDLHRFGRLYGPAGAVERGTDHGFSRRTLQALVDAGLAVWDGCWTKGESLPSVIPTPAPDDDDDSPVCESCGGTDRPEYVHGRVLCPNCADVLDTDLP